MGFNSGFKVLIYCAVKSIVCLTDNYYAYIENHSGFEGLKTMAKKMKFF